jgi:anthranilate phosphoribosyltransferase
MLSPATSQLTRGQAEAAMEEILAGRAGEEAIVSFLGALRERGVTVEELVGFATVMRRHATKIFPQGVPADWTLVDTCGTGGDARGTFNISTCAAFVVAGTGVRVAKHGNRSISSQCGSADVLEALGVDLHLTPQRVAECIAQIGIGFLFAPLLHTAVRHAMPARRRLGGRTVFNLLGPLTNPAGAQAQVLGVYDASLTERAAQALVELGTRRAFVVHGADGLDEVSLSGETRVSEVRDGAVRTYTVTPEDFGLPRALLSVLAGGDAQQNAQMIRDVLGGQAGPRRDVVLANAAAALVAAGAAADWCAGVRDAAQSIDSGRAARCLATLAQGAPSSGAGPA